jgi:hypothetical protein
MVKAKNAGSKQDADRDQPLFNTLSGERTPFSWWRASSSFR